MAKKALEAMEQSVETKRETAESRSPAEQSMEAKQETAENGSPAEAEHNKSGFYCYIGPNLKGLIQTGTIYRGTRKDALAKADKAITANQLVKALIVSGDALPSARVKVRQPGNVLYANYQKLKGKGGN